MATLFKKLNSCLLIALILIMLPASTALADQSNDFEDKEVKAAAMTADILIVRPFSFVGMILGTVVFVVAVPFAAMGGNAGEAFDHLMAKPAKYTFVRPLGQFD